MKRIEINRRNSKTRCSIFLAGLVALILATLGTSSALAQAERVLIRGSGQPHDGNAAPGATGEKEDLLSNAQSQEGLSATTETLPRGQLSKTLSGEERQESETILLGPRNALQNIFNETFEGAFPAVGWTLYGDPTWEDTSASFHGGSRSGWCAGSALPSSGGYVNDMNSWMVYGPFSLADATGARVKFWFKNYSELNFDYFKWLASTDGFNFSGYHTSGNQNTWRTTTFDLANVPNLGNLSGQGQVWIAFVFSSDFSDAGPDYTGAFTDDIVIEKDVGSTSPPVMRIDPLTITFSGEAAALTEPRSEAKADPGAQTVMGAQTPNPIPVDEKLIDGLQIMDGFTKGPTSTVVVNLTGPRAVMAATDFRSRTSLAGLQVETKKLQQEVLDSLPGNDVKTRFRFHNISGFSADVTVQGLRALQADPRVVSIEPVYILRPHLAQGISLMHGMSYRSSYNGMGLSIAICDTGIDYNHQRLGGGGFPNSKVLGGYDFGDDDSDPIPNGLAHGTACAGIAAGDLGTVGDYIGGVAYNAKLYALKISHGADGYATSDAMVAAWDWCVTHKNDNPNYPILVISTSFGGGRYFSAGDSVVPSMTTAANNAVAAGITVLASSGNDGYCDSIAWPACISSVIAVGGVYDAAFGNYYPCVNPASCAPKP